MNQKLRSGSIGLTLLLLIGLTGVLSGCGPSTPAAPGGDVPVAGDIPDNQVFVPISGASGAFTLTVPEGWASSTSGAATTYTDKLNSVTVEQSDTTTAPTVASVTSDVLPALLASRSNATAGDVAAFSAKGGSGIHFTYTADSAPDQVTGTVRQDSVEVYLFWQSGQQVALTLEGPTTADNVDPWKIISDSFAWTGQ